MTRDLVLLRRVWPCHRDDVPVEPVRNLVHNILFPTGVCRLTTLANSWAGSFGFTYDALSRRAQTTRPNNVTTNYSYDNLSRLLSALHQFSGSTIDGAVYTVDPAGNRTSKADQLANVTTNYGYDAIYELLHATQGGATTESYSYDPVGNRLSSLGVSSYTTNTSNEVTAAGGVMYTYDYNGNMTSKINSSGTTSYAWDYENRLASVTLPNSGGTVTFKYDPFGRRIYKQSPNATSIFVYDSDNLIQTVNGSGALVAHYTQDLGIDEPLAMQRGTTTDYYEADGLGSITSLTASNGTVAQSYAYDSFGNITNSTGSLTNFFRYTAREFDTETNLYYYRARYYDPNTGRFLSEDPLRFRASADFYSYLDNGPISWVDPSGLCKVEMKYTPVKVLGITLGYHAFLVVTDNTGGGPTLFYRGGPSGSWWNSNVQGVGGFYNAGQTLSPDFDPNAPSQTILDDCSSCKAITNKLDQYVLRVNISNIPYRARTTNSNAFASGATAAAGLPVPTPPSNLSVPGFGTPLPVVPLPALPK